MSTKIGIVSEGASDFLVLKHIVDRYLKEYDVYTIPLKPKLTIKGRQIQFQGDRIRPPFGRGRKQCIYDEFDLFGDRNVAFYILGTDFTELHEQLWLRRRTQRLPGRRTD